MSISGLFNLTAAKITVTVDADGDQDYVSTGEPIPCRFRESHLLDDSGQNREDEVNLTIPTLWLPEDTETDVGDVWLVYGTDNQFWRVTSVLRARGSDASVHFVKCAVERFNLIS